MKTIPTQTDARTLASEMERPTIVPIINTKNHLKNPAETYLSVRERYNSSFLLESLSGPQEESRYSVIGCKPLLHLKITSEQVKLSGRSKIAEQSRKKVKKIQDSSDPLYILKKAMFMDETKILGLNLPRYILGVTGYLSYDYIRPYLKLDSDTVDELNHPILEFILPSLVIVFDHQEEITYYASLMMLIQKTDFEKDYSNSLKELQELTNLKPKKPDSDSLEPSLSTNFKKKNFERSVEKIKNYIRKGHTIQTVISRRIDLKPSPNQESFYTKLREINPSPYMFFLDFPERSIIGSSPEALIRVKGKNVLTRPIAGTRRRGESESEDEAMEQELLGDEKERAEHVMLVDLGRNDIGKVSKFGSVKTSEFMEVEKYGDVQHIVSTVEGELKEENDAFDALRVVFPAGTVSGAPKVRSMEIIDELEPSRRGIYSGAVGSFSFTGDADFSIAIRTLTAQAKEAHIQVGAGIVADSEAEKEYYETQNKALSLLRAAGVLD